jgi:isoleucyl-tRNA synthetase
MNPTPQKTPNAEQEEKTLNFWREKNIFQKTVDKKSPKGEYRFFEGPPTANGKPGIHHVAARSFKDIIPRYKTMQGFSVRRKAGWDTHGLPVELQVEKALGLKSKKEIEAYGVAAFNKQCKESVWTYKEDWEKLTERMGFWLDMKNPYITYDNGYIEALWATIKRADERGHLYKDFKVLPWCTRCGTALSSHELNQPGAYKDVKDLSVFVKFPIIGFDKAYFLAWTTTPWTLPGNVALAVGADIDYVEAKLGDEILVLAKDLVKILPEGFEIIAEHKGSEMVGMKYGMLYPFMNGLISEDQQLKLENAYQIYPADFVTTTDGTGIVHTAVMYGADDFDLGTKHNLPKFHLVNEEGKFITGAGFLEGRYVKEQDENGKPTLAVDIINDLTTRGLLFKKENYSHSYPHCWRCDTPLIYYARTSWYFNMSKLRDQLLAANEKINWEPEHIKEGRFGEWLDGIKDWAISRDRYWGTPLPIWSTSSNRKVVIGGLDDLKKYSKKSGNTYTIMRHGQAISNVTHEWDCMRNPENHLTEEGRKQVAMSAETIKHETFDVIIASSYVRTTETAEITAQVIGFDASKIIFDDRIEEWKVGPELQGTHIQNYFDARNSSENRYMFKMSGGESFNEVIHRAGNFLYDIEKQYQGKNILIVTHNATARALLLVADGFTYNEILNQPAVHFPFDNAELRKASFVSLPHNENYELDFHKPYIDQVELELDGEKLLRTAEVMDVWFDSGSMPIAQDHKLGEPVNFDPMPADYIAEGVDQTRGWFYTMHAVSNMLHDNPTPAYLNVLCMGLLLDATGVKMSKSRGNIIEPWEMFNKYGADVVRFWFYSVNQPGEPKNFDEKGLDEVNKKVFNLLRNIVSFYEMYAEDVHVVDPRSSNNVLDKWILTLLDQLIITVTSGLDSYQVLEPSRAIREFIGEFSTWYVRRSRDRFKSDDAIDKQFAISTTNYVLRELAKIMAPFTPFLAEEIWQKLKTDNDSESVHLESFPEIYQDQSHDFSKGVTVTMNIVRDIVTRGLESRSKENIKVRQPLSVFYIGSEYTDSLALEKDFIDIIKDELNVKDVQIDASLADGMVRFNTTITDELRAEGDMRELVRKIQDMRKMADLIPSDRVEVSLTDAEPSWYAIYGKELRSLVGAQSFVWSASETGVKKI